MSNITNRMIETVAGALASPDQTTVRPIDVAKSKNNNVYSQAVVDSAQGYLSRIASTGLLIRDKRNPRLFRLTGRFWWHKWMYDDGWRLASGKWYKTKNDFLTAEQAESWETGEFVPNDTSQKLQQGEL